MAAAVSATSLDVRLDGVRRRGEDEDEAEGDEERSTRRWRQALSAVESESFTREERDWSDGDVEPSSCEAAAAAPGVTEAADICATEE